MNDETQQFTRETIKQQDAAMQISVRAWIALILVVAVCYMAAFSRTVEEPLYSLAVMAVGFYFGQQKNTTPPKA